MLIGHLPHRLSSYLYHHAHDDLADQDMGFLISVRFVPSWASGTWKLVATGRHWGDEVVQTFRADQVHLLRITGEKVSISELAWNFYRAYKIVRLFREQLGTSLLLEEAARRSWNDLYRLVDRVMAANGLGDAFSRELLNTELFLMTIAPIRKKGE